MAIAPGTKLGPYEIVQPIGAGGMGDARGRARELVKVRGVDGALAGAP